MYCIRKFGLTEIKKLRDEVNELGVPEPDPEAEETASLDRMVERARQQTLDILQNAMPDAPLEVWGVAARELLLAEPTEPLLEGIGKWIDPPAKTLLGDDVNTAKALLEELLSGTAQMRAKQSLYEEFLDRPDPSQNYQEFVAQRQNES